ncbi:CDK5 regulatory subunit-associated protein 2-like protein, partial [Lates japonicus]
MLWMHPGHVLAGLMTMAGVKDTGDPGDVREDPVDVIRRRWRGNRCHQSGTERHCGAEKRARPKSIGPMMDFSCDETDKGPPVQMHSLREFEQHLNDLKKENFSLKLRIYFLEEKIQQKFEESSDDVHRR